MAINKDLRLFIEKKFREKKSQAQEEYNKERHQDVEKIRPKLEEYLRHTKEIKSIVQDHGLSSFKIKDFYSIKEMYGFTDNVAPKSKELENEKERLIIKISLEKDYDSICNILRQFDISL